MWPYRDEEHLWLGGRAGKAKPDADRYNEYAVRRDVIDAYIAEGRRLRAEAMARHAAKAGRFLARSFGRAFGKRRPVPAPEVRAQSEVFQWLISPLTSIRSSSELLRDDPDMPIEDRKRFLDIIVEESERLTAAIDRIRYGEKAGSISTRP